MNTNATSIPAIQLTGVTKRYNGTTALQEVTLELEAGKIYGLLGRNGAGKTTLLSLLTTLRFPTRGTIRIFGEIHWKMRAFCRGWS
jgi:ABC-2 type transport system ATP-binding protein